MLPSTQNYLELNLSICYPRDLKLFYTKLSGIKFDNLLSKRFKVVLQHLNAALLKVGLWTWIKQLRCAHHGILVVEIWRKKKFYRRSCKWTTEAWLCPDIWKNFRKKLRRGGGGVILFQEKLQWKIPAFGFWNLSDIHPNIWTQLSRTMFLYHYSDAG